MRHKICAGILLPILLLVYLPRGVAGTARPLTRIAFGSCADQNKPQPIWATILRSKPDLFLFLGDNIYADTEDMEVMQAKYARQAAIPGFRKLRQTVPVLATWDDHDYGINDGGSEYSKRAESQQLFLNFFGEPKDSPRRKREGIYDAKLFGPPGKRVQIILLDTRYFRSPLRRSSSEQEGQGSYISDSDPAKTMLGEAQWRWLEGELRIPAEVRIIVSSIQVVPEDHGWEKWANFPLERQRLFELISKTGAAGVIFISGDRHLAELSMMDGGVGYPLYDVTASALTNSSKRWRPYETNRHRVGTMNWGDNFGLITVDWNRADPQISLQIRDVTGDVAIQKKIYLSTIRPGTIR